MFSGNLRQLHSQWFRRITNLRLVGEGLNCFPVIFLLKTVKFCALASSDLCAILEGSIFCYYFACLNAFTALGLGVSKVNFAVLLLS